jgi:protein-tyrosine phosphatase
MFDLHSHLLPGLDDGAADAGVSLAMARAYADQGVLTVVCTPHILPGLYHNTGPQIRDAVAKMQQRIDDAGITLKLLAGADNHLVADFVAGLKRGHLLSLADTSYVLVEPPHHVAPLRLDDFFFNLLLAGYIPVLTHPERLSWIEGKYEVIENLAAKGVWMQITCGSLRGAFGRRALYWAERLLSEGLVHILATDAHDPEIRRPDLLEGRQAAERIVGSEEAKHLVVTRPFGVLSNKLPKELPVPVNPDIRQEFRGQNGVTQTSSAGAGGGFARRMRRLFG